MIDLAARQLGLGNLKTRLSKVTSFIPEQTNKAILAVIDGLAKTVPAALLAGAGAGGTTPPPTAPAGLFKGLVGPERRFEYQGKKYILFVTSDSLGKDAKPQIKLALETPQSTKLYRVLQEADFFANSTDEFQALYNAAKGLIDQTAVGSATAVPVRGQSAKPTRPTPTADPQKATNLTNASTAFATAIAALEGAMLGDGCKILLAGCFAAGTKLLTREGWRAVETLREGDEVASRPEHDVYGSVSFKPIEEVFIRTGRVLHLHLSDGQLIRTTPEHPFWVEELGWTPADMLRAGMRLATLGGEWVSVEEAFDTGEYETVYNCRVAEYHTYFVGDDTHVLAVWAHNTYNFISALKVIDQLKLDLDATHYASLNEAKLIDLIRRSGVSATAHFRDVPLYGPVGDVSSLSKRIAGAVLGQSTGTADAKAETAIKDYVALVQSDYKIRKDAVHAGDFNGHLKGTLGDVDALAKSFAKYEADYRTAGGDPSLPNRGTHAHHIVYKEGLGKAGKEAGRQARDILLYVGIDPYWGRENLAWAPNAGHPDDVVAGVPAKPGKPGKVGIRDKLQKAYDVLATRNKAKMIEILEQAAKDYISARI